MKTPLFCLLAVLAVTIQCNPASADEASADEAMAAQLATFDIDVTPPVGSSSSNRNSLIFFKILNFLIISHKVETFSIVTILLAVS